MRLFFKVLFCYISLFQFARCFFSTICQPFFAQLHKVRVSFFLTVAVSIPLSLSLFRLITSHITCLVVTALIVAEMLYSAINHSFCCHHHDHDHHHHHHPLFIYLFIFISILLFNAKKTRQINTNSRHFSCFLRSAHLHLQIPPWHYKRITSSF